MIKGKQKTYRLVLCTSKIFIRMEVADRGFNRYCVSMCFTDAAVVESEAILKNRLYQNRETKKG